MFTPVSHLQRLSDSQAPVVLTEWVSVIGRPITIWFSPLLVEPPGITSSAGQDPFPCSSSYSGHSFSGHPKLSWSGWFPTPKLDVWRVRFQEDSGLIHSSQGILLALVECVDPLAETKINLRKGLEPLLYDLMVTSKTGEKDQLCPRDV